MTIQYGEMMDREKVWRDSVVLALRDAQWKRFLADSLSKRLNETSLLQVEPPGFGLIDARARPVAQNDRSGPDDRYFLIEVASELRAYARRRDALPGGQCHFTGKLAELVYGCGETKEESEAMRELSLRGHYVGYWASKGHGGGRYATVDMMPAIVAASQNQTISDARNGIGVPRRDRSPSFFEDTKGTCPHEAVTAENFFSSQRSPFGYLGMNGVQVLSPLGMLAEELERYIDFLCEGATDSIEPIHAVVMSTRWMTVCTDINHLASVVGADLAFERDLLELAKRKAGGAGFGT